MSGAWRAAGAQPSVTDAAVHFLASAQNSSSGTWSADFADSARERADTLAVILALDAEGGASASLPALRAKGGLLLRLPVEPQTTLDMVLELECNSASTGEALLAARNADGGWGTAVGQMSDPLDTALAAESLLARGIAPADGWDATAQFLLAARKADGFWSLSEEPAVGKLELSARVLRVLKQLKQAGLTDPAAVDNAIAATLPLLRACFRADGRFSLSDDLSQPPSPVTTAELYRTMVQWDPPANFSDALSLLGSLQQSDGRWTEPGRPEMDVYTTSTVLMAFVAVKPPPSSARADLMVLPSAVSFAPANPDPGQSVTVTAVIFNTGSAVANSVDVAFFNGDPRNGGTQIGGTQVLSSIAPRGSQVASVVLDTTGLTAGPLVFVQADPDGKVAETDVTNNLASRLLHIAGLPDATAPAGVDLFVAPRYVSFNGEVTDTVFLIGSPVVTVRITIANLGSDAAGAFVVRVLDGTVPIGRLTVQGLAGATQRALELPWLPGSGTHAINVSIDADSQVAETDEDNNSAAVNVSVIGSTCAVIVRKYKDGVEQEPPFAAYDVARFLVATAYQGATVDLVVTDSQGIPTRFQPMPLFEAGKFQWNVTTEPAGTYTVTATFAAANTGTVLDHAEASFEVLDTVALRSIRVSLPKDIVEGGAVEPIQISATLANGSNVEATWAVSWRVLDPAGAQVAASTAAENVTILGSQMSKTLTLAQPITGTLSAAGRYTVVVSAAAASAGPFTGQADFSLLPPLHLNVTNQVVPDQVAPLGKVRVKTVLRLSATGQATGLDVPVAITDLQVSPSGNIVDSATSTATIAATGIINAIGEIVPDGTKIAAYVPYGIISAPGSSPAPGTPANPQIRIFDIVDGAVSIAYAPRGGTLGSGQYSLTVMEFHQYHDGEEKWLGSNIGNAEIFLMGQ
ncbi:MAG: hypothetical protein A3K18_08195 [Lentisphaerae bacterium RIFOXYA12_64_32]|nr:MAG: hypothetical protein A3K18_08195 [Lentisphaerae bacterium RIFOXYA12_64_32]